MTDIYVAYGVLFVVLLVGTVIEDWRERAKTNR